MKIYLILSLILAGIVFVSGCVQEQPADQMPDICKINPRPDCAIARVTKCGDYYIFNYVAQDVGYDLVDSNGTKVASCGGMPLPPGAEGYTDPMCGKIKDLRCDYGTDFCITPAEIALYKKYPELKSRGDVLQFVKIYPDFKFNEVTVTENKSIDVLTCCPFDIECQLKVKGPIREIIPTEKKRLLVLTSCNETKCLENLTITLGKVPLDSIIYENNNFPPDTITMLLNGKIEEIVVAKGSRSEWSYFVFKANCEEFLLNPFYWGDNVRINPGLTYEKLKKLDGRTVKIEGAIQANTYAEMNSWKGVQADFQLLVKKIIATEIESIEEVIQPQEKNISYVENVNFEIENNLNKSVYIVKSHFGYNVRYVEIYKPGEEYPLSMYKSCAIAGSMIPTFLELNSSEIVTEIWDGYYYEECDKPIKVLGQYKAELCYYYNITNLGQSTTNPNELYGRPVEPAICIEKEFKLTGANQTINLIIN